MTNILLIITWSNYNSQLVDMTYLIHGQFTELYKKLTQAEAQRILEMIKADYPDYKLTVSPYSHFGAVEYVGLEL